MGSEVPLQLQGYNNLTKTLSVNGYNLAYTPDAESRSAWQQHIAERYSCANLTQLLSEVAKMIGASVLNIASQTYDPQGASVTMLIAEQSIGATDAGNDVASQQPVAEPEHVVMHLDKSHLTVHTYPDSDLEHGISNVRVDIDVSSCGIIPPIKTINYLLRRLESDIVHIDYRVRGFARGFEGKKHFTDHKISSIQNSMAADILQRYRLEDVNLRHVGIFHTRMVRETLKIEDYLFGDSALTHNQAEPEQLNRKLLGEMREISRWTA